MSNDEIKILARSHEETRRQMRERGYVSPLRGPVPSQVDVRVEKCSDAVYLATPMTRAGSDWLSRNLAARPKHLFFCNGLVLHSEDVRWLLLRKLDAVSVQVQNYVDDWEM